MLIPAKVYTVLSRQPCGCEASKQAEMACNVHWQLQFHFAYLDPVIRQSLQFNLLYSVWIADSCAYIASQKHVCGRLCIMHTGVGIISTRCAAKIL